MSTSGESSDDDPMYAQYDEPAIAPLAPKVILQEEGQVEVSASPAFQCLDEVSGPSFLYSSQSQHLNWP